MISWSAAILAGGRARRLGGVDKGALVVGDRSIVDRQVSLLRGLTPHLLIVAGDRSRYADTGVPVVADRITGAGALGGVHTALEEAPAGHVLIVGCDMPFLSAPFVTYLIEQAGEADVVVPRDARGLHPLCALYACRTAPHFEACARAGRLRLGDALRDLRTREIGPDELAPFDPDGRLLLNVNTPDDLAAAQALAARDATGATSPDASRRRA